MADIITPGRAFQAPIKRVHSKSILFTAPKGEYPLAEEYVPTEGNVEGLAFIKANPAPKGTTYYVCAVPQGHSLEMNDMVEIVPSTKNGVLTSFAIKGYNSLKNSISSKKYGGELWDRVMDISKTKKVDMSDPLQALLMGLIVEDQKERIALESKKAEETKLTNKRPNSRLTASSWSSAGQQQESAIPEQQESGIPEGADQEEKGG